MNSSSNWREGCVMCEVGIRSHVPTTKLIGRVKICSLLRVHLHQCLHVNNCLNSSKTTRCQEMFGTIVDLSRCERLARPGTTKRVRQPRGSCCYHQCYGTVRMTTQPEPTSSSTERESKEKVSSKGEYIHYIHSSQRGGRKTRRRSKKHLCADGLRKY
jgi:hypothetical protein